MVALNVFLAVMSMLFAYRHITNDAYLFWFWLFSASFNVFAIWLFLIASQ